MTEPDTLRVRPARAADAEALARIYEHYVRETVVTFEEEPVSAAEMARRIESILAIPLPWLVAEPGGRQGDGVVGYAYATPWKARRAYRFAVESTVYVDPGHGRRGIGSALYRELLPSLAAIGAHAVLGGIALPNPASIALHERFGFVEVGRLREVGFKHGRWIDVGYWQRILAADASGDTTEEEDPCPTTP